MRRDKGQANQSRPSARALRKAARCPRGHACAKGVRCRVCGLELGAGKALADHLARIHRIDPASYRACYPGRAFEVLLDEWDEDEADRHGHPIITHVLVRRFVDRSRRLPPRTGCVRCSAARSGPCR